MVLSACSPYFQALFINHPEKHPIVILKDVPFADMKSLLDFMYRGEVSVDQERLTAFLKVAESLRIKGLTEVNDDKQQQQQQNQSQSQQFSSGGSQQHNSNNNSSNQTNTNSNTNTNINNNQTGSSSTPPPQLHRIHHPYYVQQQKKTQGMLINNPLLGSALTMPKRKRGRPRKLSGSSNGTGNDFDDYDTRDNLLQVRLFLIYFLVELRFYCFFYSY